MWVLHTKRPLTNTEVRKARRVRLHHFLHLVLQHPSKPVARNADAQEAQADRKAADLRGSGRGQPPAAGEGAPPILGLQTGVTPRWAQGPQGLRGTVGLESSQARGLASFPVPGTEGRSRAWASTGARKRRGAGAAALLLGLGPPAGQAAFLQRQS